MTDTMPCNESDEGSWGKGGDNNWRWRITPRLRSSAILDMDCMLLTVWGFTFLLIWRSVGLVVPSVFSLTQRWDCPDGKVHCHRWHRLRLRSSEWRENLALKKDGTHRSFRSFWNSARWKFVVTRLSWFRILPFLINNPNVLFLSAHGIT